jgi:hypothetical protein
MRTNEQAQAAIDVLDALLAHHQAEIRRLLTERMDALSPTDAEMDAASEMAEDFGSDCGLLDAMSDVEQSWMLQEQIEQIRMDRQEEA